MKKQSGNVIEWLIVGVVLIGAVALIAWRYMEADKAQNDADQAANSSAATAGADVTRTGKDLFQLKRWGEVFVNTPKELPADDISVEYYKDQSNGSDAYYMVSATLKKAKFTCKKTDGFESNGAFLIIQRSYKQQPSQPVETTKKEGDYYYWVLKAPQGTCYSQELMSKYFAPTYTENVLTSLGGRL